MKKIDPTSPIGIFDSGIGGLTVAHAIRTVMPGESLIYFGDTAHHPYGDKSEAAIQAYSIKIADALLRKNCKVIVIACNSASSAAYELLKEYVRVIHILNVVDPMIDYLSTYHPGKKVGLIGTKRTVDSNIYATKMRQRGLGIDLRCVAAPLIAPMIEEGFFNNQISHDIIGQYLSDPSLEGIEALVLACTHYPLIKKEIINYYSGKVSVLDSSNIVARALKVYLQKNNMVAPEGTAVNHQFMVSDYTQTFENSTRMFFHELVHLELNPLWS